MTDLPLTDLLTLCANRMREAARQHDSPEMPAKILLANAEHMDLWAREIKRRMKALRTETIVIDDPLTRNLITIMTCCSEIMRDTARRMGQAGLHYPELVTHSAELMNAADIMATWIEGIKEQDGD